MFLECFCKCYARMSYVFTLTAHRATLASIYHLFLLKDDISVLAVDWEILDGCVSPEVHLSTMFAADVFAAFT